MENIKFSEKRRKTFSTDKKTQNLYIRESTTYSKNNTTIEASSFPWNVSILHKIHPSQKNLEYHTIHVNQQSTTCRSTLNK